MDFANEVKQSLPAFRKAHDSPFIWHSGCFWEIASSLRSSQNPFSTNKIRLNFAQFTHLIIFLSHLFPFTHLLIQSFTHLFISYKHFIITPNLLTLQKTYLFIFIYTYPL